MKIEVLLIENDLSACPTTPQRIPNWTAILAHDSRICSVGQTRDEALDKLREVVRALYRHERVKSSEIMSIEL